MVLEAAHDDATVSYLLSQALLAEQEAKEVEELEAKLTRTEQRLMRLTGELREHPEVQDDLSRLEMVVITWVVTKTEVMKKGKIGRGRRGRSVSGCRLRSTGLLERCPRCSPSTSQHYFYVSLVTASTCVA